MRIAVVTCKVKPPSSDYTVELDNGPHEKRFARASTFSGRLPATHYSQDDFVRELTQLMNFHGKCKQDVIDALELVRHENLLVRGLLRKTKRETVAKINASVNASNIADICCGRLVDDSFIAATIRWYIGDECVKNAVGLEGMIRNRATHAA
uniref:Uncharacterized protein n=1 Tax=Parascaris equorum TaxID=6256 RepID=A0A914S0K5_PAREQ